MTDIIILRGVFKPELLAPQAPIIRTAIVSEPLVHYTELPSRFTSLSAWPLASNLKCWNCSHVPQGRPCFVPTEVRLEEDGTLTCRTIGNFDSWRCAARYAKCEMHPNQHSDIMNSIRLFAGIFTDSKPSLVFTQPAPSKTLLREYCGKNGLTREQWLAL